MPVPRCSALRRDGQPCSALASSPDAIYCRHHEQLVELHGDDAVRQGRYPRKRSPQTEIPVVVETEGNGGNRNVVMSPADVRPALAQAAAASLDEIQQALLDAALGTVREHWATFTCPDCGKKHRARVHVPDVRSRVAAIELLLREGLGRPAQAEEPPVAQLPDSVEAVKRMSWSDLQAVFALQFADDIATVTSGEAGPVSVNVSPAWARGVGGFSERLLTTWKRLPAPRIRLAGELPSESA
jgi:hypothetical protein